MIQANMVNANNCPSQKVAATCSSSPACREPASNVLCICCSCGFSPPHRPAKSLCTHAVTGTVYLCVCVAPSGRLHALAGLVSPWVACPAGQLESAADVAPAGHSSSTVARLQTACFAEIYTALCSSNERMLVVPDSTSVVAVVPAAKAETGLIGFTARQSRSAVQHMCCHLALQAHD